MRRRQRNLCDKRDQKRHITAKQNAPNELSVEGATSKKHVKSIEEAPNRVIMLMHAVPLVISTR